MILEAKNIEYVYKSQKDRKVLGDISVRFEEKKFYAIIGASGAGKTTLLSLLAGLDSPTGGTVLYEGPFVICTISSASFAKYLLCVTTITHFPNSCAVCLNNSIIPSAVCSSRFPVGSSANKTFALLASALAIATRCCCPPDSFITFLFHASCGIFTFVSSSPGLSHIVNIWQMRQMKLCRLRME